jgi:hypothetical protein
MKVRYALTVMLAGIIATAGAVTLKSRTNARYLKVTGDPTTCTRVLVTCNGLPCEQCQVITPYGIRGVYSDTHCTIPITHSGTEILIPE